MDDSGKTKNDWGLDAWRAEEVGAGEMGDVMGNFEEPLRTGSTCMDHTLQNVRWKKEVSATHFSKSLVVSFNGRQVRLVPQGYALGRTVQASPPSGSLRGG